MKKIMVVDDDTDVTTSIKQTLEHSQQYEVVCAASGQDCLKKLHKQSPPDLIILDIMMPKMSGWECFKKIQENPSWSTIPVIFLTARTDEFAKKTGNFLGEDFITKPYDVDKLKEKIDTYFKK